jgi:MSHA pilin protein MshA
MHKQLQRGFTLIELIIVIVILGILSVVAAPRFIDITSDARTASLEAMQAAVKSANTLVYAKAVINGQEKAETGSVLINSSTVSTRLGNIMPLAENLMLVLDGSYEEMTGATDTITAEWGIFDIPGGKSVYIVPQGFTANQNCKVLFNVDASIPTAPTFFQVTSSDC